MMRAVIMMAVMAVPSFASAQQESCPLLLPDGAIKVVRPPAGWIAGPKSLVRITGAGVMSGPPSGMAYLVPYGDKKTKGGHVTTFVFQAGDEKWLWCEYGTAATHIAKRMADAATKCELTTKEERRGVYSEVKVVCN